MNDDVLQPHRIEPIISEFTPDPNLDSLFRQAQIAAREHGWDCPSREEFEAKYNAEIASKRSQ